MEQKLAKQAQSCFLANGLVWQILKRNKQRTRNVILAPGSMHRKILEAAYSSWVAGHTGVEKTLSRVQSNFWWPGVTADVVRFVKGAPINAPLQSLATAREPNEQVHMDLFSPLKTRSALGNKLILVITDAFTKYTEFVPDLNKEVSTIGRAFF